MTLMKINTWVPSLLGSPPLLCLRWSLNIRGLGLVKSCVFCLPFYYKVMVEVPVTTHVQCSGVKESQLSNLIESPKLQSKGSRGPEVIPPGVPSVFSVSRPYSRE